MILAGLASLHLLLALAGSPPDGRPPNAMAPDVSEPTAPVKETYTFGIAPQRAATDLARQWAPLLRYLSEKTGHALEFKTARDIATFEARLAAGEYDFTYLSPYHYVTYRRSPGYLAFAREKNRSLMGIIVVRADSPYRNLRDLNGQTLAFSAPGAFAASLIPRAHLRSEGIAYAPTYVVSQDSVYYGVAKGLFAAGGGIPQTLDKLPADVRGQLRTLWTSRDYAPHVLAVHPRVAGKVREQIFAAMAGMEQDARGRELLESLGFHSFAGAYDGEYDEMRALAPRIREVLCADYTPGAAAAAAARGAPPPECAAAAPARAP